MLCDYFGISRQAHHQMQQRQAHRAQEHEQVMAAVQQLRHRHRRLGTRKLQHELAAQGITIGRDRLFALLGGCNLLLKPVRRSYRTTWPGTWRCDNLLATMTVTAPNQAWVSDITYLATETGFRYLVLITDVFSRRIMGFDLSDSLAVEGLARALDMALAHVPTLPPGLVLHSDHGIQYTCHAFRQQLARHHIRSSMGEVGNCYDNALAERINGILKLEYGLDGCFPSHRQALRAVQQAVYLYNVERPHLALNLRKPDQVYHQHFHRSII